MLIIDYCIDCQLQETALTDPCLCWDQCPQEFEPKSEFRAREISAPGKKKNNGLFSIDEQPYQILARAVILWDGR